jgi:hypothetical protein
VKQQKEQREEQGRRKKMTGEDAVKEWHERVQTGLPQHTQLTIEDRKRWRNNLQQYFNINGLKTICFEMGIDYENFSPRKDVFARELIEDCERNQRLKELQQLCQEKRPNVDWSVGI